MEPNWSRLWENPKRKICSKQEIINKITSLDEGEMEYYFEYISDSSWNDDADEAYIKLKKRIAVE
jgi:hypothetical protein